MENCLKKATRDSYGEVLKDLGSEFSNIVVLDADLAAATKTSIFKGAFPERHIDCGIAEANMMGTAAGLSLSGFIPFVSTFAMFATGRTYEQIRNSIAYPKLNVKICATHGGITVAEDGATHQCIEDLALMRVIPGMVVINPADDQETRDAIRAATLYNGPVYVRLGRPEVPCLERPANAASFEIGKGVCLREGKDITIVATGICVSEALYAADALAKEGIDAEVINIHTIKPLDEEIILKSAAKTGKVLTVEEHSIIGGLGSAVADCLIEKYPVKMKRLGVTDSFGESATADELMAKFSLNKDGIIAAVKNF